MKKNLIIIIILITCVNILAQTSSLEISLGTEFLQLSDFKDFLNSSLLDIKEAGIEAKILEEFPNFPVFSIYWIQGIKDREYQLITGLGHYSTGSRIYYEDYSGFYRNDILINSLSFEMGIRLPILVMRNFLINFDLTAVYQSYKTEFIYELSTNNYLNHYKKKYYHNSGGLKINFNNQINLKEKIYLFLSVGYDFIYPPTIELQDIGETYFIDPSNNKVDLNMSSLDLMIGIGINFQTQKPESK